jgi:hypothetical protein
MKRFLFGMLAVFLFGCSVQPNKPPDQTDIQPPAEKPMPTAASLPDLGPAPELTNDTWLNVDAPLRLADLRGKVVMIDMWTFG